MEDSEIVRLYLARDEAAVRATDEKYGRLCKSVARSILSCPEDAEECVNDSYVAVWNAIPPTLPSSFPAYLCKTVRNLSLKRLEYLSREKRSQSVLVSLDELESILPDEAAEKIDESGLAELISTFLHSQKESVRLVFVRKYYFFDSIEAIADRYSFTPSKVKNMLFRTRSKLREYLIREGFELPNRSTSTGETEETNG